MEILEYPIYTSHFSHSSLTRVKMCNIRKVIRASVMSQKPGGVELYSNQLHVQLLSETLTSLCSIYQSRGLSRLHPGYGARFLLL